MWWKFFITYIHHVDLALEHINPEHDGMAGAEGRALLTSPQQFFYWFNSCLSHHLPAIQHHTCRTRRNKKTDWKLHVSFVSGEQHHVKKRHVYIHVCSYVEAQLFIFCCCCCLHFMPSMKLFFFFSLVSAFLQIIKKQFLHSTFYPFSYNIAWLEGGPDCASDKARSQEQMLANVSSPGARMSQRRLGGKKELYTFELNMKLVCVAVGT